MKSSLTTAIMMMFLVSPVHAAATIIDFDSALGGVATGDILSTFKEEGYVVTGAGTANWGSPYSAGSPLALDTNAFVSGAGAPFGGSLTIERADGGVFGLIGFDVSRVINGFDQDQYPSLVFSWETAGGLVHSYGSYGYPYYHVASDTNVDEGIWETVLLGDYNGEYPYDLYSLGGLVSLSIGFQQTTAIDNIRVSSVPIPPAVWLFGSALAGLGWMRRKQTG